MITPTVGRVGSVACVSLTGRTPAEVPVEPFQYFPFVVRWVLGARKIRSVIPTFYADQLHRDVHVPQGGFHHLRLTERHGPIRIAVYEQDWCIVRRDVIDRRCSPGGLVLDRGLRPRFVSPWAKQQRQRRCARARANPEQIDRSRSRNRAL